MEREYVSRLMTLRGLGTSGRALRRAALSLWKCPIRTVARAVLPALFFALVLVPPATADMMYSYVGDTFRSNVAEQVTGVYTLNDRITGWFTVADGFVPPRQIYQQDLTAGVLDYSFTDGHQTLTKANSTGGFSIAVVPELSGALLRYWTVAVYTGYSSADPATMTSTIFTSAWGENGDRNDRATIGTESFGQNTFGIYNSDGSHQGVWTATSVPEPATLVLLAAGLIVMGVAVKRQSSRRAVLPILLTVLILAPAAAADTMYSYVGDTFHVFPGAQELAGVYTLADRITGSLIVADGFVPVLQGYFQDVTPGVVSYSFTDGHQTLTQANSIGYFRLAVLPFDGRTYLNSWWSVSITTPTSGVSTYLLGDRFDYAFIGTDNHGGNSAGFFSDGSRQGTWTATTVPEPSTLVLLAAGLIGVAAVVWRTAPHDDSLASAEPRVFFARGGEVYNADTLTVYNSASFGNTAGNKGGSVFSECALTSPTALSPTTPRSSTAAVSLLAAAAP